MQPLSASQLVYNILHSIAKSHLLGTGTDAGELNDVTKRYAQMPRYQQALNGLGLAARKAQRNRDLIQARQEFRQVLESDELGRLVEASRYLKSLLNEGLEGDDAKFRAMVKQLAVIKS